MAAQPIPFGSKPIAPIPFGSKPIAPVVAPSPAVPSLNAFGGAVKSALGTAAKVFAPVLTPLVKEASKDTYSKVTSAAQQGVEKAKAGYSQVQKAKTPLGALAGGTKLAAGVVDTVSSPMAPVFAPLGRAVQATGEKIADIPAVQKFAMSPAGDVATQAADFTSDLSTVAGAVAGGPLGGKGVARVATDLSPTAPFKGSFKAHTAAEFAQEGIIAPVSALTTSPFLRVLEAMSAKGMFGGKIMEQISSARKGVDVKIAETAAKATPAKAMSDEALGKTMAGNLRESVVAFKDAQDKVFTKFSKRYGAVQERPFNTTGTLAEILADQGQDFFRGTDPRLQRMFDRLTGESDEVVQGFRQQGMPETAIELQKAKAAPQMTIEEMRSTRTSLGEALVREPDNTAIKRLYGALTADLKAALSKHDKVGATMMKKLDADYAAGISRIESRIAQSIEQANPENIVSKLMMRDSADAIEVLKGLVKPDTFKEYQKFFIRNIFEKSIVHEKFSVEKLKSLLAEYDSPTLDALLEPDARASLDATIQRLEQLERLSEALKPGEKILGGSQTAFNIQAMAVPTAAAALVGGGNFLAAAATILGQYGVSKMFTSPLGRKFLTGGGDVNVTPPSRAPQSTPPSPLGRPTRPFTVPEDPYAAPPF